jgi:hypothetical protein
MRKASFLVLFALLAGLLVAPAAHASSTAPTVTRQGALLEPVSGSTDSGGTFSGVLKIRKFVDRGGTLTAVGRLSGTLRDASGAVLGNVTGQRTALPVTAISGTCQILHLELGPLDLNLLGLVVHLNRVVLDITAQSGAGQLLGNLLCAIANLLNPMAPANVLATLLNYLLTLL